MLRVCQDQVAKQINSVKQIGRLCKEVRIQRRAITSSSYFARDDAFAMDDALRLFKGQLDSDGKKEHMIRRKKISNEFQETWDELKLEWDAYNKQLQLLAELNQKQNKLLSIHAVPALQAFLNIKSDAAQLLSDDEEANDFLTHQGKYVFDFD
jgi:hypothetical protein